MESRKEAQPGKSDWEVRRAGGGGRMRRKEEEVLL